MSAITLPDGPQPEHGDLQGPKLDAAERRELMECESQIAAGLDTFYDVAKALYEIRTKRLYRETFESFEAYCRERWEIGRRYANRLIQAGEVLSNLGPIGPKPENEAQARELARNSKEIQAAVMQIATKTAPTDEKGSPLVTAAHIRAVGDTLTAMMLEGNLDDGSGEPKPLGVLIDAQVTEEVYERMMRQKTHIREHAERKREKEEKPAPPPPRTLVVVDPKRFEFGEGDIALSYCADIIETGRIRKPFQYEDTLGLADYANLGGRSRGEPFYKECFAYRVQSVEEFLPEYGVTHEQRKGETDESHSEARNDPFGFYHRVLVEWKKKKFVLVGPPVTFATAAVDPASVVTNVGGGAVDHPESGSPAGDTKAEQSATPQQTATPRQPAEPEKKEHLGARQEATQADHDRLDLMGKAAELRTIVRRFISGLDIAMKDRAQKLHPSLHAAYWEGKDLITPGDADDDPFRSYPLMLHVGKALDLGSCQVCERAGMGDRRDCSITTAFAGRSHISSSRIPVCERCLTPMIFLLNLVECQVADGRDSDIKPEAS